MEYKYGTIYRNMLALPRFNVCKFYELSKTNVMLSTIFKVTNNVAPGLIHECPYYNVSQVNISLTIDDAAVMFAQGDYRVFNNISDSPNGKTLLKISTILSISSPYKESYGKK
ncbi:hypothetical protein PVAND_017249 [Polypedilum vanderplanki]|uniref:Uncharacterized protein n=1 Tax=Polypedilum vanderplanki TaxID=319348 RepID=A0A9J6BI26_POLVA|nr:hypothetical protein PVAND_017249 [Polypedilum vanderplanki]